MKKFLLLFGCLTIISCNRLIDEVKERQTQTISYSDYSYDIDSKNRRGFIDTDYKPMTGHYIVVHDSIVAEEFVVKDGFLNGVHKFYNKKGILVWEKNYRNNSRHGIQKTFYDTGSLKSEVTYTNGRRESDLIGYNPDGALVYRITTEGQTEYEHFYENDNRVASKFVKIVDGSKYDIVIMYSKFGQPELIFGKDQDAQPLDFYYFDMDFNRGELMQDHGQQLVASNLLRILFFDY